MTFMLFKKTWLLLALTSSVALAADLPRPVRQALSAAGIPQSSAHAVVQDLAAARPSLSVNAGAAVNPASVMKLLTTYAALDEFRVVIDPPQAPGRAATAPPARKPDLVVTIGGDGTLLAASHAIGDTPILGINSAPDFSVGFFCSGRLGNGSDVFFPDTVEGVRAQDPAIRGNADQWFVASHV